MRNSIIVLCLLLLSLSFSKGYSQTIQLEKQLILGTWVSNENDLSWVFENDSICREYYAKQIQAKYLYKITPADSYCGRLSKVDKNDRLISFLELRNFATKEVTCYEINGVNKTTLSITEYMMPEPAVFRRKNISSGRKK
jgi:hypothetical protein